MCQDSHPEPPVDEHTGLYQAPLRFWMRDKALTDADLARTYTCMECNKSWRIGDPAFRYFRFGREGSISEGYVTDTLGWFARCADREACAHRRANTHAGVHPESLTLADEALLVGASI